MLYRRLPNTNDITLKTETPKIDAHTGRLFFTPVCGALSFCLSELICVVELIILSVLPGVEGFVGLSGSSGVVVWSGSSINHQ